jgi:hypothetical protein
MDCTHRTSPDAADRLLDAVAVKHDFDVVALGGHRIQRAAGRKK